MVIYLVLVAFLSRSTGRMVDIEPFKLTLLIRMESIKVDGSDNVMVENVIHDHQEGPLRRWISRT